MAKIDGSVLLDGYSLKILSELQRDSRQTVQQLSAVEAETVEAAVEVMRTKTISAVILDVRLPGTHSGLDVLDLLRRIPEMATVPVLIVTGSILTEEEERRITRQRAHVVYKPEGFNTILNFLDQLTGRDYSG